MPYRIDFQRLDHHLNFYYLIYHNPKPRTEYILEISGLIITPETGVVRIHMEVATRRIGMRNESAPVERGGKWQAREENLGHWKALYYPKLNVSGVEIPRVAVDDDPELDQLLDAIRDLEPGQPGTMVILPGTPETNIIAEVGEDIIKRLGESLKYGDETTDASHANSQ